MSSGKAFKKGHVRDGELVFDKNFELLDNKKTISKISLAQYLANSAPKSLSRTTSQGGSASFANPQIRPYQYHHLAVGHQPNQSFVPSPGYGFDPLSDSESVRGPLISEPIRYHQAVNSHKTPLRNLEILQDDLSEAMDTGSDMDDEFSENMDMSSGPEADDGTDGKILTENMGGTASKAVSVSSGPDIDDEIYGRFPPKAVVMLSPKATGPVFELEADCVDAGSDDISETPRMSSTPSGVSGPSSHTSAGPSNLKESIEKTNLSFDMLKAASPSSSLSSIPTPAKSSTPQNLKTAPASDTPPAIKAPKAIPKPVQRRTVPKGKLLRFADLPPRSSIPINLSPPILAQQGVHAAYSSRLNPFALHPDEYQLLRHHICHLHVSAYLNIRNRILRLWVRNPLVSVTAEEAAGCALASLWLGLAEVAYEWLVRKGYINFGCVEPPEASNIRVKRYVSKRYKRKTIVVIGAGMSGLGCARQLEGLFGHYRDRWTSIGEEPPKVVLLEGRNRVGGRVYSHPLKGQKSSGIPDQKRSTAEMGAHIIIGFDHGNPMSMIVRGQLALHYYALKDNSTLHDIDGNVVDEERDQMAERLYNDVLDRASVYRHRMPPPVTVEGDKEMIEAGRDPNRGGGPPISSIGEDLLTASDNNHGTENVPVGMDKLTGKAHLMPGPRKKEPPAQAAEAMGWKLASNVLAYNDLNLDVVAKASKHPTLGAAMDEAVKQYQFLLDLSPQDLRLINWHYANLEYANAANVGKLSLGGWDQDAGNEFEGVHAQVIGGYQQVPRGILHCPTKLDLRTRKIVKQIEYNPDNRFASESTKILCEDGDNFDADHIVLTTPLGVLKDGNVNFDPPLPDWKIGPIQRLGYGTLNKVILVYDKAFWKVDQDMFGLLREPEVHDSLDQEDYIANRGRFYFFWNCIKTTGRPVLISLMAGDAAHQAESSSDADLVAEVTQELAKIFKQTMVPQPIETIVTRWGKDRFARGSYSYVGATSLPGDYEAMAAPIGTLHFAGEATCATHPATVHGAYISGLRAASEIIDDLLGPIEVPSPLVSWPPETEMVMAETPQQYRPTDPVTRAPGPVVKELDPVPSEPEDVKQARLEAFESDILQAILNELGFRPAPPGKPGSNPFLLFTKDNWAEVKKACDDAHLLRTGDPNKKAERNEIRAMVGQIWREASNEAKRPYFEQTESNRKANLEEAATFDARLASWDEKAMEVRKQYVQRHPGVLSNTEEQDMWRTLGVSGSFGEEQERRGKKMSGYAEDSDSNVDV
ncbi:MAG: hypothetical protein ASARMPRED_002057 [Alectoria sarmentosa]|nr:MAG: hypothetical protein ASARMPRED_002057 [Alectoria sarmentosa]